MLHSEATRLMEDIGIILTTINTFTARENFTRYFNLEGSVP